MIDQPLDPRKAVLRRMLVDLLDVLDDSMATYYGPNADTIPTTVPVVTGPLAVDSLVAEKLTGVSRRTLQNWVDNGLLEPVRTGGKLLFLVDDLRASLESFKGRPKSAPRGAAKPK